MKRFKNFIKTMSLTLVLLVVAMAATAQEYNVVGTNDGVDLRFKSIQRFLDGKIEHLKRTLAILAGRVETNTNFIEELKGNCPSGAAVVAVNADGTLNCETVVWREVSITTYSWYAGSWDSCSSLCGGASGTQSRVVECHDGNGALVAESNCTEPKPAVCNSTLCAVVSTGDWTVGDWSACSETCGGGIQTRSVTCEHDTCTGTKPATTQNCNTQVCPATCTYGAEESYTSEVVMADCDQTVRNMGYCDPSATTGSTCTSACATKIVGRRTSDPLTGGGTCHVFYRDCSCAPATPPTPNTYAWSSSDWGSCSTTCGGGDQTRSVVCKKNGSQTVDDAYCAGAGAKPAVSQGCNAQACAPVVTYSWVPGNWKACSLTCGGGIQIRNMACRGSDGVNKGAGYCAGQTKPPVSQDCNTQACPSSPWDAGPWSTCSATCGGGVQTRSVTCTHDACEGAQPPNMQSCNTQACIVAPGCADAGTRVGRTSMTERVVRRFEDSRCECGAVTGGQYRNNIYCVGPGFEGGGPGFVGGLSGGIQ